MQITYGIDSDNINITDTFKDLFIYQDQVIIPQGTQFNLIFGDPVINQVKEIIIKYQNNEIIIKEDDCHNNQILLSLSTNSNQIKPNENYLINYGTIDIFTNITQAFIKKFIKNENSIYIPKYVNFNKLFGDPIENVSKSIQIYQNINLIREIPEAREDDLHFSLDTFNIKKNNNNKLIIIAIFKNESHILEEWIAFHLKQGVDKIYLIDNGSTDNYQSIVKKYLITGDISIIVDSTPHAQNILYNKYYLPIAKLSEWVLIIDLDEFIYSRGPYPTIVDYLDTLDNNISRIHIPWKCYGSNGHIEQPNRVLANFTKRAGLDNADIKIANVKSITRGSKIKTLDLHHSNIGDGIITISGKNSHPCKGCHCQICFGNKAEDILNNSSLHINHYCIQSKNWFMDVKMKRGDALNKQYDIFRNLKYFKDYDYNDITDTEILTKL